jgi:hypothetical protein
MKILLVEAALKSFSRVKDGSVKFNFQSNREMDLKEFSLVDQYYQQNGFLAFKLDEISLDEIPDENTAIKGQRSPSQLLRNHIFALHMKKGGNKDNFTPYYTKVMAGFERAIQNEIDAIED